MIGRRVPRMHVSEPGGQQTVLGEREDQARCGEHRTRKIAADRKHRRQRDRNRARRAGKHAPHVHERRIGIRVFGDHRDENQHDKEVEEARADHSAYQGTRQYAARFRRFPGRYRHGFEPDIGVDQEQRRAAEIADGGRRRRDQCSCRHMLQPE